MHKKDQIIANAIQIGSTIQKQPESEADKGQQLTTGCSYQVKVDDGVTDPSVKLTANIQRHQHKPGCHVVNKADRVLCSSVTKTGGVIDLPVVMNEADVGIAQSVSSTEANGVIDPSGKVTHDNIVHLPDHFFAESFLWSG